MILLKAFTAISGMFQFILKESAKY